jgi:hypothetical protein
MSASASSRADFVLQKQSVAKRLALVAMVRNRRLVHLNLALFR